MNVLLAQTLFAFAVLLGVCAVVAVVWIWGEARERRRRAQASSALLQAMLRREARKGPKRPRDA